MNLIDYYNNGHWSLATSPETEDSSDVEEDFKKAGFEQFDLYGNRYATHIELYRQSPTGKWLVIINSFGYWHPILAADTGSVIMLMRDLLPWAQAGNETRKMELIEEAADLLFGHERTAGPLAEALEEREKQRREQHRLRKDREQRAAQAESRKQAEAAKLAPAEITDENQH